MGCIVLKKRIYNLSMFNFIYVGFVFNLLHAYTFGSELHQLQTTLDYKNVWKQEGGIIPCPGLILIILG